MAIDIYFAGYVNPETHDYIWNLNGCRLQSQLNERRGINDWVEKQKNDWQPERRLFVDSGAFSAYTKGSEVDVDDYIEYINGITKYVHLFAQVDKIPGVHGQPKTKEDLLEAPKLSWENYLYMRERVKEPDKLMPVFHRRENFDWLNLMLETTFKGAHIPYIGIAATTDSSSKEKKEWFERVFNIIRKSSNPNVKTHAFGMTSERLMKAFPFTSADSTRWIKQASMGYVITPWGTKSMSTLRLHEKGHLMHLPGKHKNNFLDIVEEMGFDVDRLLTDVVEREKFNILYVMTWSKENHECKNSLVFQKTLF